MSSSAAVARGDREQALVAPRTFPTQRRERPLRSAYRRSRRSRRFTPIQIAIAFVAVVALVSATFAGVVVLLRNL
jgi:hypothetical protein